MSRQKSLGRRELTAVLAALGELLGAQGIETSLVIAGGTALNLLGVIERATRDVDVLARVEKAPVGRTFRRPIPLPENLTLAIRRVGRDFGLSSDWMNTQVAEQWASDPPEELFEDVEWRTFGALEIGWLGRPALIALKLHAAADRDRDSVHYQDLIALAPGSSELENARAFVVQQDTAAEFPSIVDEVIDHVQRDLGRSR